jgi:hypothetical protein
MQFGPPAHGKPTNPAPDDDDAPIAVNCGRCGAPVGVTLAELDGKWTIECPACAQRSNAGHHAVAGRAGAKTGMSVLAAALIFLVLGLGRAIAGIEGPSSRCKRRSSRPMRQAVN